MNWSLQKDIREIILKKWEKGDILRDSLQSESTLFPFRWKLKGPKPKEVPFFFEEISTWIQELKKKEKETLGYGYEVLEKEYQNTISGKNKIPVYVIIPSMYDAIKMIKKEVEWNIFLKNSKIVLEKYPELQKWMEKNVFTVIALDGKIEQVMKILAWFQKNPKSRRYLRELSIEGVDTKFIETHKAIFWDLLTVLLPKEEVLLETKNFEDRFFLKKKPVLIRFRILDPRYNIEGFSDITIPIEEFRIWKNPFQRVFFTENETNFLSFPEVPESCILFGKGYVIHLLREVSWLKEKETYYWGDLDTHGFNILSTARAFLPEIKSFLMTEERFLKHKDFIVKELQPYLGEIERLTEEENSFVRKLQNNIFGEKLRLEQERIHFSFLEEYLSRLKKPS